MISRTHLASCIDHTLLTPQADPAQLRQLLADARRFPFASLCVNPIYAQRVHEMISAINPAVRTCTVLDFPLGCSPTFLKASQAESLTRLGIDELDFVAHLPSLLACDEAASTEEFTAVVQAARAIRPDIVIKVILETAVLLADAEPKCAEKRVACACAAAHASGCDFVKTCTGFHPAGGASIPAVQFLSKHRHNMKVKAAGGIRTLDQALAFLAAGADRLGCSASVAILTSVPE